mmetsp:Transcript_19501/g.30961  ORF Transcript_19501/g.30961 Transcript_19501/m.30961 type:complete len:270 (-) Transcript_19501:160-969(-)
MGVTLVVFIPLMFYSNPHGDYITKGWDRIDLQNHTFVMLAAAQAGGMVIPWMIFYQQSLVSKGGFKTSHLGALHLDVVLGTFFTVVVVTSATAFVAGAIWSRSGDTEQPLRSVVEVSNAMTPFLGIVGKVLFCIGFSGAALVGGLCLSNTAAMLFNELIFSARAPTDIRGSPSSELSPIQSRVYTLFVLAAAGLVLSGVDGVDLTVTMALINAIISAIAMGVQFSIGLKVLHDHSVCDAFWTFLVGTTVFFFIIAAVAGLILSILYFKF